MTEPSVDVDLDALAPRPKRVKLGGKRYLLPGDMPMELFFRLQAFQTRVESGEDEVAMLGELREEILQLFQVNQPAMKTLPDMGITTLLAALGAIYSGGTVGEPPPEPGGAPAEEEDALQRPSEGSQAGYLALIAQLCKHYGWAHDFWKRMGIREFDRWCEVTERSASRSTSPDSWDGYEHDPFWQAAHRTG